MNQTIETIDAPTHKFLTAPGATPKADQGVIYRPASCTQRMIDGVSRVLFTIPIRGRAENGKSFIHISSQQQVKSNSEGAFLEPMYLNLHHQPARAKKQQRGNKKRRLWIDSSHTIISITHTQLFLFPPFIFTGCAHPARGGALTLFSSACAEERKRLKRVFMQSAGCAARPVCFSLPARPAMLPAEAAGAWLTDSMTISLSAARASQGASERAASLAYA